MTPEERATKVAKDIVAGDGPGVYSIHSEHPTVMGLIEAAIRAAIAEEREACARVAENWIVTSAWAADRVEAEIATAIRARGGS